MSGSSLTRLVAGLTLGLRPRLFAGLTGGCSAGFDDTLFWSFSESRFVSCVDLELTAWLVRAFRLILGLLFTTDASPSLTASFGAAAGFSPEGTLLSVLSLDTLLSDLAALSDPSLLSLEEDVLGFS